MTTFTIDREFKILIPPLTADEYAQLEANLVTEGCRDPLVIWQEEGILLDGHNRHVICTAHGIPTETRDISLPDRDAARVWILRNQLGRRNLCDLDRAALALRLKPALEEQARQHQGARTDLYEIFPKGAETHDTGKEIGALAGVSDRTVDKAAIILTQGTTALQDAVRNNAASIHTAATLATLPAEEQDVLVAGGKPAMLAAAKRMRQETSTAQAAATLTQDSIPCGICERPLTDPDSVARGIGPVCAGGGSSNGASSGGGGFVGGGSIPRLSAEVTDLEFYLSEAVKWLMKLEPYLDSVHVRETVERYEALCVDLADACTQVVSDLMHAPIIAEALADPEDQETLNTPPMLSQERQGRLLTCLPWEEEPGDGMSPVELQEASGHCKTDVANDLGTLRKQGKVRQIGRGRYVRVRPEGAHA